MLPHSFWWLTVNLLAVYRLTVLVGRDTITKRLRPERHLSWTLFMTCPWCTGAWFAAGAVALTRFWPGGWQYIALALALSGAAGFLAER